MQGQTKKIKVLTVDDSALVRRMLREILEADPDIIVVGQAGDPIVARTMIKDLSPDVLTLDIEMPKMDGLTFLGHLMRLRPMPVVMVSSLTERGAHVTMEALALGALDFVPKPRLDVARGLEDAAHDIVAKVKAAARAGERGLAPRGAQPVATRPAPRALGFRTTDKLVAIGASTGGVEAIHEVLAAFPPDAPGTVIAQHMPAGFSAAFAARLDRNCAVRVLHAEDNARILPGHVYVAPGGWHLRVVRHGAHWICRVTEDAPVNLFRPSVDVLFSSVAASCGLNAVGVLLTGMGSDGAQGLKQMREAGARTIAQDEATSVVWGMPGSAVRLGAASSVLPLGRIAGAALEALAVAA